MKNCMPDAYKELVENCEILEKHYKDMMVYIFSYSIGFMGCLYWFSQLLISRVLILILPFVIVKTGH